MSRVPTGKEYVIKTFSDFANVPLDFLAESVPDILEFIAYIHSIAQAAREKGLDVGKMAGPDWAHLKLVDDGVRGRRPTEFFGEESRCSAKEQAISPVG